MEESEIQKKVAMKVILIAVFLANYVNLGN